MPTFAIASCIYAAVLIAGGLVGFLKGKSSVSLLTGVFSAVIPIAAAFSSARHPRAADAMGAIVAVAIIAVFVMRYRKTGKPMPAMPMIAISAVYLFFAGYELLKAMGKIG
jgi:uncharacterized membrane protein (UPF0136 family)